MKNSKSLNAIAILLASSLALAACTESNADDDNNDTTAAVQNVPQGAATEIIADWPATPKMVAEEMIQKYGQPQETTESMLIWQNNGIWKRTIVFKEEIPHHFPAPHTDLLQQFIDYKVPTEKYDNLAEYDGSVIVERTKGEISARCDKEEFNLLAINLAHDVAMGTRTIAQARAFYAQTVAEFKAGNPHPYTQGIQFERPQGQTQDPDMEFGD